MILIVFILTPLQYYIIKRFVSSREGISSTSFYSPGKGSPLLRKICTIRGCTCADGTTLLAAYTLYIEQQAVLLMITSVPGRNTPGWPLCKTLNIISANEIAYEEYVRPPVMLYDIVWFQLVAARVTCTVWDICIHKTAARVNGWMGCYSGIPRDCLPVFKFGQVSVLFSLVTLSQLAKSEN